MPAADILGTLIVVHYRLSLVQVTVFPTAAAHRQLLRAVLFWLVLFSAGVHPVGAQTIRIGLAMPRGLPSMDYVNGMYELFKSEVEANTDGAIMVQIYYGGVLGKPDERLNQMRRNVIQMSDASDGNYATIHRDIQIFSMPYLFPTIEIAHQVLDGPLGTRVAQDIRNQTGIRVLGWWETAGFKHYSSNTPIRSPSDMEGKKMRVMGAAFSVPVSAMGGAATPIPMTELYISLKTGVVDGQDNAVGVFNMLKLYEVQKFITLDGHIYGFGPLGINDEFFAQLSADHQAVVLAAGKKAVAWNRIRSRQQEAQALSVARANNVTVIAISEQIRKEFASATQPAAIAWLKRNVDTPSLVDSALQAVEQIR